MTLIIRHFDNPYAAQDAFDALRDAGVPDDKIGLLTKHGVQGRFDVPTEYDPDDYGAREGTLLGSLAGLVAAVAAMATPLGPIIAVGPLFGALVGVIAGAATGGVVASLVDFGMDESVARRLAATLEDDEAVLLSVEVPARRVEEIKALLAQTEELHADEVRFFRAYHEAHQDVDYEEFHDAYHFGYRQTALEKAPYTEREERLREAYPGDYDRDREAILVGFQRYLDTVQVLEE